MPSVHLGGKPMKTFLAVPERKHTLVNVKEKQNTIMFYEQDSSGLCF